MTYALLSLALPVAMALLLMLLQGLRWIRAGSGGWMALATTFSLVAAIYALDGTSVSGETALQIGGWQSPLGIRLLLTPLKAFLLVFVALIHLLVDLYALRARPSVPVDYWPLSGLLHGTMAALLLSADIFNLYVCLELLSLSSVALVTLSGPKAYSAALNYLLLSLGASLCYLMGVAVFYGRYGVLDIMALGELTRTDMPTRFALLLMTVGLMVKGALWPLHLWLPAAHTHAPTPVSALLSGLVVKGPLFILWELWTRVAPPELGREIGPLFAIGGVVALVSGGWSALRAAYIKTLVAYSTVAQLGYAMMGLGLLLLWQQPRYQVALWVFVVAHGLAKASMFLAAGEMQNTLGSRRIVSLRGATQTVPVAMTAFGIAGTSLIGLPPTGGFLAKWVLLQPILTGPQQWPWALGVLLGTVVSAAYVFRTVDLGFFRATRWRPPRHYDRVAQWLSMLPAILVWGMALIGENLIDWLWGVTD